MRICIDAYDKDLVLLKQPIQYEMISKMFFSYFINKNVVFCMCVKKYFFSKVQIYNFDIINVLET